MRCRASNEVRLHTVGRPLPGVEVRISDAGEILVRSGKRVRRILQAGRGHARKRSTTAGCTPATPATSSPTATSWCWAGCRRSCTPPRASATSRTTSRTGSSSARTSRMSRCSAAAATCCRRSSASTRKPVGHWAEVRGISYMSYADLSQKPEVVELVAAAVQHVNATLPDGTAAAALRQPAQGVRCRRRRDHAHPQAPPQRRRGALPADHRRHLRRPRRRCTMKRTIGYEIGRGRRHRAPLAVQEV